MNESFLFLPGYCLLCGDRSRRQRDLCEDCEHDLPRTDNRCLRCALPLTRGTVCGGCLRTPPPQHATRAAFDYRWPIDALVQDFKFNRDLAAGRVLGELLANVLEPAGNITVIPVPLHASRLAERGFNQAEQLAQAIAARHGLALDATLVSRRRATAVQSGMDAPARHRNVRGAFELSTTSPPARVAIVDDVVTTGSTTAEIARLLQRAGVVHVEAWTLARTAADY